MTMGPPILRDASPPARLAAVCAGAALCVLGAAGSVLAQAAAPVAVEGAGRGAPLAVLPLDPAATPSAVRAISPTGSVTWVALPQADPSDTRPPMTLAMPCDCEVVVKMGLDGQLALEMYARASDAGSGEPTDPEPDRAEPVLASEGSNRRPAPRSAPLPRRAPRPSGAIAETGGALSDEAVEMARAQLLAQLTRAAEEGLVTFAKPDTGPEEPATPHGAGEGKDPPATPSQADASPQTEAPPHAETPEHAEAPMEAPDTEPDAPAPHMAGGHEPEPEPESPGAGETSPKAPSPEAAMAAALEASSLPITVTNVLDETPPPAPEAEPDPEMAELEQQELLNCAPEAAFELADLGAPMKVGERIGDLRRALIGDMDLARPAAVLELARYYIRIGFGAEAKAVLRHLGGDLPEALLLNNLADIMDGRAPRPDGPVFRGADCPGRHAIWRAAAHALAGDHGAAARAAALMGESFDTTARDLRALLGPKIAMAVLLNGDLRFAESLEKTLQRSVSDPSPEMMMFLAALWRERGDERQSDAVMAELAQLPGPIGVEASLAMADRYLQARQKPPPGFVEELGAKAFELRGLAQGRRLLIAEARARAAEGALKEAIEPLLWEAGGGPDTADLRATAWEILANNPMLDGEVSAEGLRTVLDAVERLGDEAAHDERRIHLARRLTRAGLPTLARRVLSPALARASAPALVAEAEIAIELGEASLATSILAAIAEHPEASALSARAAAAAGDFAAAAAALSGAEADPAMRGDYAWRSGDWTGAAEGSDPGRQALAAYMSGSKQAPEAALAAIAKEQPDRLSAYESLFQPLDMDQPVTLKEARSLLDRVDSELQLLRELRSDG